MSIGHRNSPFRDSASVDACSYCLGVVGSLALTQYTLEIWDDAVGGRLENVYACASEACRILADKDVGDARMNCEQRRRLAAKAQLAADHRHRRLGDAFLREAFGHPAPSRSPMIDADAFHEAAERPSAERPPLRPDGFAQSQVDAAKAVLLASVPRKGKL